MNVVPDRITIQEVAAVKQISESFVEKDWYVTQVIKKISEIRFMDFQIIYTGGTAMSKAHKLIQRFSEDIDFRVISKALAYETKTRQRKILSEFKGSIIQSLETDFQLDRDKVLARDDNRFLGFEIDYSTLFSQSDALRPHIRLEFTVSDLALPPVELPVSSFINELTQKPPEIASIACTDLVENASEKLSAITWRIPHRVRGGEDDDPAIVRHIQDLSIVSDRVIPNPTFKQLVIEIIRKDNKRASEISGLSLGDKFKVMMQILNTDQEYGKEYQRFVMGMSYATDGSVPSFPDAISKLQAMIDGIIL